MSQVDLQYVYDKWVEKCPHLMMRVGEYGYYNCFDVDADGLQYIIDTLTGVLEDDLNLGDIVAPKRIFGSDATKKIARSIKTKADMYRRRLEENDKPKRRRIGRPRRAW
jgi:hypothetical protein